MKEKQKAKELTEKFKPFVNSDDFLSRTHYNSEKELKNAKQCALIDVQNTIDELNEIWKEFVKIEMHGSSNFILGRIEFYSKVKLELTNTK